MASQAPTSPSSSSSIPKRAFSSFTVRRASTSATQASASRTSLITAMTPSTVPAVAASPTAGKSTISLNTVTTTATNQTTGSGIPASLRSLRNFLPFGGGSNSNNSSNNGNNTTTTTGTSANTAASAKSGFAAGFGAVRRSMHISRDREKEKDTGRKMSLSNESMMMPVLAIDRRPSNSSAAKPAGGDATPPLRRSVSLSGLEDVAKGGRVEKTVPEDPGSQEFRAPLLRTPSPGPCLLTELSTIIEADSSGISRHLPLLTPSTESSLSLSSVEKYEELQRLIPEETEDYTIRRPILQPATPLMHSSALRPSTPIHQQLHYSTSAIETTPSSLSAPPEGDLDLSTSQLALQVKDAMARASTSWTRSSDKAFVIDADTSFMPPHDTADEGEADPNASLLAVVDIPLDSPTSDGDDTSRMNNSVASFINPNELLHGANATMDLGSLDPDLRAVLTQKLLDGDPSPRSPDSIGHSTASGRTITLSLPPIPPRHHSLPSHRQSLSSKLSSNPSTTTLTQEKPSLQPIITPSATNSSKRRVVSSLLPRIRSPPRSDSLPGSAPISAKNSPSPSPHKTSFDFSPPGQTGPRAIVFFPPPVPPIPVTTSTPTKANQKKGFDVLGTGSSPVNGGHARKSSVPVGSWRNSREFSVFPKEKYDVVQPEVRVVEASSEIDPTVLSETTEKRRDGEKGKLHVETLWTQHEGSPGADDEKHRLGSPFCSPGDREKLDGSQARSSSHLHSPSPSPASLPRQPSHHLRSTTPNNSNRHLRDQDVSTTPMGFAPSPSPSPYLPPQSLVPSPVIPSSSPGYTHTNTNNTTPVISRDGSLRGTKTTTPKDRESDVEGSSPSRVTDGGSLSGRPSRRMPAPLRLFWGGSNSGSTASTEDRIGIVPPERQPSPLRRVLKVDKGRSVNGDDDDDDRGGGSGFSGVGDTEDDYFGGGATRSTRPSMDGSNYTATISIRPSLDSSARPSRPSMESYGASSMSGNGGGDPGYYKYVVETPGPTSRPSTRMTVHRDRERERDKEGQGLVARVRKRSMSVQENFETTPGSSSSYGIGNLSSAVLSARERLARARYGDLGGGTRPWSSMSMRSGGRRTTSNDKPSRKSAIIDRDKSPVIPMERSVSERAEDRDRERSGSVSQVGRELNSLGRYALRSASEYNFGSSINLSTPQLLGGGGGNVRSFSRMTFTEGHGRKESTNGLIESPTFTVSTSSASASGSRDRDTQRSTSTSTSTGLTSISQSSSNPQTQSSNIKDRDRERDREELANLKEKHSLETGALLSALSDSQRTCKVLREENIELRDRIGEVERENERLKRIVGDLEREVEFAQRERERDRDREGGRERGRERLWDPREDVSGRGLNASVWGPNGASGGSGVAGWRAVSTPVVKQRERGSALRPSVKPVTNKWDVFERDLEPEQMGHHNSSLADLGRHTARSKLDKVLFSKDVQAESRAFENRTPEQRIGGEGEEELITPVEGRTLFTDEEHTNSTFLAPTSNNTDATTAHLRRPSTSSSIFPVPPPNMTMLLHDEMMGGLLGTPTSESNRSSPSLLSGVRLPSVSPHPPSSKSRVINSYYHPNHGLGTAQSNVSVSPTTENFSMITTGSPGSLFLKPEHEMMLDEMESLDLGRPTSISEAGEIDV